MGWIKLLKDLPTKHGKIRKAGSTFEVTKELEKQMLESGVAVSHVPVPPVPVRIDPALARQMELEARKQKEKEISEPAKTPKAKKDTNK